MTDGLTAEQRMCFKKIRDCVAFVSPAGGVAETQAAFDRLFQIIDSQAAQLRDVRQHAAALEMVRCELQSQLRERDAEIGRLLEERDKLAGVIAAHDLCHDLHGKVDAQAFADGCANEQRKLYGCAPDRDRLKRWARAMTEPGDPEVTAAAFREAREYHYAHTEGGG